MTNESEEIKSTKDKKFYLIRIIPALILVILFVLPLGMESLALDGSSTPANLLMPWKLPFSHNSVIQESIFHFIFFLIYFLPLNIVILIISLFLKDNNRSKLYLLFYISLSIYLFCSITNLVFFANCSRWFCSLPVYIYITVGFAFITHAIMSILGIFVIRQKNPDFAEYKKMQAETKERTKNSIKTKLTITIISTIAVILLTFTILVLRNYKKMYTEAVSDVGRAQAEQTSAVYEAGGGMYDKIHQYFDQQEETNKYSECPFERIDIILQNSESKEKPADEKLPSIIFTKSGDTISLVNKNIHWKYFDKFGYTTKFTDVKSIPEEEKKIDEKTAESYFEQFQNGNYKKHPVNYGKFSKYIYPVSFTRKDGNKLVGFSIVTYRKEILMRSYFHVLIFVCTMAVMFLYISIILALFIADFITNPLLYLRTNVRKTSNAFKDILEGNSKIEAEKLTFKDSIKTHDETKALSLEIKNMVGIIRRIMPYISFSTLQAAKKDRRKSTTMRELCFLFTDIRGFTSLCESKPANEVVELLNHYLDIETEIILNNGGDVDKFVGDEMMAFFAGPKKEYNACKAAMEIRQAMRLQQQQALKDGSDFISIGIGINTGSVIFGSVGAPSQNRMDYTSIGDTVNLAARLEGANKAYGSKSIITEAVFEKLKNAFVCRELDFITVKGKTEPVRIFEILQTKAAATDKLFEIKALFEKGLDLYRKQKWDEAEKFFRECNEKYEDMPSVVFIDRIAHFKKDPPPRNWDGVFVMKVK
ncbi:MAG: adenylate/guanylate cyclase domain-containing protein [Treponema sp.]|nr:adenylate/guanylate cyclase domain-containing protein [Treponema sp.]